MSDSTATLLEASSLIDPEKIKDVIGSGGKTINKIIDETGVKIDIEDDGTVFIASVDAEMSEKAKKIILSIVEDVEVGDVYDGTVVRQCKQAACP